MKIVFLFLAFISGTCLAQDLPKVLLELGEKGEGIITDAELSKTQKDFFEKNLIKDRDGVILLKSDSEYQKLIETFKKHPDIKRELPSDFISAAEKLKLSGYSFFGILYEDEYRTSLIFTGSNSELMFTRWNYKDAGATISVAGSFVNRSMAGVPAVLSRTSDMTSAIWKTTWWKNGTSFEIYISDELNSRGSPALNSDSVLKIAQIFE